MLRDAYLQRRIWRHARRARVRERVVHGMRRHPLFTTTLLLAAFCAVVCLIVVVVAVMLLSAVVAGLGFLVYRSGRNLLQTHADDERVRNTATIANADGDALQRYLYAVEEFSQLTDAAVSAPIETPVRGKAVESLMTSGRCLAKLAESLRDEWHGGAEIGACLDALESASAALSSYLRELQKTGSRRLSTAELRWRRDDLIRRRDHVVERLRATDFRNRQAAEHA